MLSKLSLFVRSNGVPFPSLVRICAEAVTWLCIWTRKCASLNPKHVNQVAPFFLPLAAVFTSTAHSERLQYAVTSRKRRRGMVFQGFQGLRCLEPLGHFRGWCL